MEIGIASLFGACLDTKCIASVTNQPNPPQKNIIRSAQVGFAEHPETFDNNDILLS